MTAVGGDAPWNSEIAHDDDSLYVNPGSPPPPPGSHTGVGSPLQLSPPSRNSFGAGEGKEAGAEFEGSKDGQAARRGTKTKTQQRETLPSWRPRFTRDPDGDGTYDETTVDVVTVPCPGGHPLRSWTRDGLMSRYFGAPSMRNAEAVVDDELGDPQRPVASWVRQGIRREASRARILLYEHPPVTEGVTMSKLADALLQELQTLRCQEGAQRPLLFIGHGVGGLVVKMALCKASRSAQYDAIARHCYGVAFFGTPHQGSAYLAMPTLAPSIQSLLQLETPLPVSITDDLRVGNSLLLHIDDEFKSASTDLQIWTFYETIDSRLSSRGSDAEPRDVYFTAPLTSIKSAILGMRQESIFPLQSDHANIASFGRHNVHTLRLFLKQLAAQINRADLTVRDGDYDGHWTLGLEQKVNVEVHGFYDDPPIASHDEGVAVRAWSTRLPLKEFLAKGPDACLSERLHEVDGAPEESRFLRSRGRTSLMQRSSQGEAPGAGQEIVSTPDALIMATTNALGIQSRQAVAPGEPMIRPVEAFHERPSSALATIPQTVMTPPSQAMSPDACLSERLHEVDGAPEESRFLRSRGRTSLMQRSSQGEAPGAGQEIVSTPDALIMATTNALGIQSRQAVAPGEPMIRPVEAFHERPSSALATIPQTVMTPPSQAMSPVSRHSTPMTRPSPLIRADFDQDLAIDRLSPPPHPRAGRAMSRSFSLGSDRSPLEFRDFPALSQRSRSTLHDGAGTDADDDADASSRLPDAVVAMRKAVKSGERGTSETVIEDEAPAMFAKPDVRDRRFVWVHVPYNNPTWAKKALQTLETSYKKDYSTLYGNDFWATRHTKGRHAQHYAYFAKPGCYFTAPRTMSPRHSVTSNAMLPASAEEPMYTCLFLPYLHFDSYKRLIRRRDLILRRLDTGRSRPVPESVAKSDSLELQVVWEFLGHDPPVNCRRTMDQYRYPSLRDTRSRDDDQMLYKLTKERTCAARDQDRSLYGQTSTAGSGSAKGGRQSSSASMGWRERLMGKNGADDGDDAGSSVLNGNVLMVDQLWLWVIHSHTVLSFFPKRESDPIEGPLYQQADLRDSIFNEVNIDLGRQCENALDLAALAALHAVSVLLDRSSHPDLEVFRIFEEAISVLNEKLTSSLKEFRKVGFRDKAFDYEPVENKARSIRARHKEEGRRAEKENRDSTSALLELRDIEDELLTLLHLFERQSKVIASMNATYMRPELRELTVNGRAFLGEALKRLREYAHQADEMVQRVRATRDDYDKLLQMVQRQAQVDEVRLSRLHADLASAQSRSVMIFTTFTVIFLPLTFFTGLFGMNTQEWGGGNNLSLEEIGTIALPSSFLLVFLSLIIAFSTGARTFFRWLSGLYRRLARWLYSTLWRPLLTRFLDACRAARERWLASRGEDGEGGGGGRGRRTKRGIEREVSDFWERHRLERERGYQIPDVNRRRPGDGIVSGGGRASTGVSGVSGTFGARRGR
ncbi:hypothetical protein DCS_01946 [Drechmeria coniospora]|uniref:Ankyrin repeat protein n=1 Tax=Drechmeria coniospora TaxID=98403 RepID=A0A151GUQ0_DRECN|nr:hypothetical protein DCS_01946 [Drechmeria coniospora]KYK60808.1 hypothetical protein DCS_01946 [Drechmeria coniospora]